MRDLSSIRNRALRSRDAVELLSNKWRIPTLHLLQFGPLRANQLQRAIDGISAKVLTQTLRGLERDGLVEREMFKVLPPHVEYDLTEMGKDVIPLLRTLCHWAEANVPKRDQARQRFDEDVEDRNKSLGSRSRR